MMGTDEKRMTYKDICPMLAPGGTYHDIPFWDAEDAEELSHTDIDEAIEAMLDARHPDPLEGTIG